MSGFKSDAQRKHFFANLGSSGGSSGGSDIPTFPTLEERQAMDAFENSYAVYWDESPDFQRNPGFKNPMPK
jgi:hypothetical protein